MNRKKYISTFTSNPNMNMNKVCQICKIYLIPKSSEIIFALPCEHMYHIKCLNDHFKKSKLNNMQFKCVIDDKQILHIVDKFDIYKNSNLKQLEYDLSSLSCDHQCSYDAFNLFVRSGYIMQYMYDMMKANDSYEKRLYIQKIMDTCNIKINIINHHKLLPNTEKKIYICNHVRGDIDSAILFMMLEKGTGFVGSKRIQKNKVLKDLLKGVPIITFNRNSKNKSSKSVVQKMMNFMKDNNSLVIYPEGTTTGDHTLLNKFRTGAFVLGYPIQPLYLKYSLSCDYDNAVYSTLSMLTKNEEVLLNVMDPFYPPFDKEKIENIRKYMAEANDAHLSRVTDRTIIDNYE